MHLTEIKLAGFKSFVDPTKIPIRSNMSAIVGPNGCGKSNIVDAIRWVIGESSAKQLRGQSMSDVIFNGTTNRKPVGRATVELHFDNSAGRITGEYANYTDIVIRREVERDGQSNYFLNGTSCRRRDILDVFLGTGLGPRSYSIIEQGMISQLIESKPEEMRLHLEEEAGISKYKERRRETENRIQHTKDNLDRLNDIREELDKQLRHLKRQANAAERYKVLKEEERVLTAQMKALHWQALEEKRIQQQEKLNQQGVLREQKVAEQRQYEAEMDKVKIQQEEAQETQNDVQKRYYQIGEEIARLESQIKHHQEQLQRWQQEYADTEHLWRELEETSLEQREQIRELEFELAELTPQEGEVSARVSEAQRDFVEANHKNRAWQKAWDECQKHMAQVNSQLQVITTKIEYHQKQDQQLKERQSAIAARLQQSRLTQLQAEIAPLQAVWQEKQLELETIKETLQEDQRHITEQRDNNKQRQQQLQHQQRELQGLEAEQAKAAALQQAALGCHDEKSVEWLNRHQLQARARLGQKLQVARGWEKAVETVLSGYFDAVCVEHIDDYVAALHELNDGRITLIEQAALRMGGTSLKAETLISKMSSDWSFDQWLQGIYVAETVVQAHALRNTLASHESVITPEGVWLGKNWIRISHLPDSQRGILEREKHLQTLVEQIDLAQQRVAQYEEAWQQGEAIVIALEKKRDALQENYQQKNAEFTEIRAQLTARTAQLEATKNEHQRLQNELNEMNQRLQTQREEIEVFHEKKIILEKQQTDGQKQRNQFIEQREECQSALETARHEAQKQQQQADALVIRMSANESQLGLLRQTLQRNEKQLTQLTERREYLSRQLSQEDSPVEKLKTDLQRQLSQRLSVEQELKAAQAFVLELRQRFKEADVAKQHVMEVIASVQTELEKSRLIFQEMSVRQQTIQEQLKEIEVQLDAVIAQLPEHAEIQAWEVHLSELQQSIHRLGPINLAAIEEFQSSRERKEYLDKQFQDLTESLETLEAAIRKIDRESKIRFRETFEKVNEGFQTIFPKIFGGGRAMLELSEEDLLTTGIIVRAQPPGKRNSTIHMLSGGEKALTAITF